MPLFEFECPQCGKHEEALAKYDEIHNCSECSDVPMNVVPSVPGWFPTGKYGKGNR